MVALTIGMAVYKDFDGVYFTIQALRMYQDLTDTELVVVDNFGDDHVRDFVQGWARGRYILATDAVGTAAPRDRVFQAAAGDAVLCMDSHVLLAPGTVARLREYYRDHPDSIDLIQGPLIYDDLTSLSTHFAPEWRGQMWGTWATDPRGQDPEGEPFDIPMQGLGIFSCRKAAWPGFNPRFRGFGGEEGYIHEKMRQAGGRTLCLPWLRWLHRFSRPSGVPYPLFIEDKLRNYIIGHSELGLPLAPIIAHFEENLPKETVTRVVEETLAAGAEAGITAAFTPFAPSGASSPDQGSRDVVAVAPSSQANQSVQTAAPVPVTIEMDDQEHHRAIVVFVDDVPHLIQQVLALRESWLYVGSPNTDLVAMGPGNVLAQLPDDLVKIEQRPAADDLVWQGYKYVNAIACLNGPGSEQLERYTHLLRTDADTFITPAWHDFRPAAFTFGSGGYANEDVPERLAALAERHGLVHRGHTNVGSTWYGPTAVVRQAAAISERLTKHLITEEFANDPGAWPGWYREVSLKYASEIAVNHCAPDAQRTDLLDASSTSDEPITRYAHIHCWHTPERFSKHAFMAGQYTREMAHGLSLDTVRDYCTVMAFRKSEVPYPPDDPGSGTAAEEPEPEEEPEEPVADSPAIAGESAIFLAGDGSRAADLPLVSCMCPTYNRPPASQHLLEEAIEAFLRQDYPNKELVILNDCAAQTLICDAPRVRVVNVAERYPTLGDKRNALVEMARGDILVPWDDDDISLPWRLSLSVERLGDADYFNPRRFWYRDGAGVHRTPGYSHGHNASTFRRSAFEQVGGYPSISLGEDSAIDALLSALRQGADPLEGETALTRAELFYVYRWGVSPSHLSGQAREEHYEELGTRQVEPGCFYLSPNWRLDYVGEVQQMLDEEAADAATSIGLAELSRDEADEIDDSGSDRS